ncbi:MAG: Gfo/Idh/MocA family oxidoreductase [Anaerolineae bacterium]|nr:Gfo/Idh/MocA family oxidoreductase [Anaerolineae bacterium]
MIHPIKIGIVGLGRAGWGMHCKELTGREDKFQIVAACDVLPERRERVAEQFGCQTYARVEDLVADPAVELVDIATRSCDHLAHAKLALEAGKDVFLEKPITVSYAEAVSLREAAEASPGGSLYARHNRRFDPDFLHIQDIIASGILGEVYEIRLARHGYQRRDDWQTIKEFGGGQLLNWGPHIIDHALRFLESPVTSQYSDLKRVAAVGDAEDHLKIVLKGENGRIVDLEISGGVALGAPTYRVFGTRGSLVLSGNEVTLKYLDPAVLLEPRIANPGTPGETFGNKEVLPWIEETLPVKAGSNTVIWDHLYAAIREGVPFPVKLAEAIEVMRVVSIAKEGTEF